MATKRIIQLPTLNQNNQITGSSGKTFVTTTKTPGAIATSSSGGPTTDGGSYVDYNATTDQSGNVIGGSSGRITYDSGGKQITNTVKSVPTMGTNKSVAVMAANKNGTTSSLPQATPANLPGVTKYAGIDKNYGNNQAGIDLVNKQSELDTLPEAEKAQRLAGAYNPTPPPTVATTQNPVIKKTLDKPQEQTVTPAVLQGADINTLNSTLDELNYKVNVEGKQLSKDEYLAYASARRQLQEMMKPQALTGGLDSLITNKENEIKQATDESKINNEQELADFTRSQEVYKQAEIDAINQADEEQKKTLGFILGGQGAGQGTFAVEQIGKITQNTLAKKQALNEAVQAKIDLYGSQLRKDSQQTIQAMKDRLDSYYMKAAEFDVDNIKQMNEYNQREGASKIEQIDKMMALAQSQAMAMQPLTEQEKAQAQAFAGNLYDNEGNFQNNVFEMLYKINPKLANAAVLQGTAIQKERISNDMAMRGLDADIKRAQLNKLLNPEKPDETFTYEDNGDGTFVAKGNRGTIRTVDSSGGVITGTTKSGVPISQAIQTALDKCKNGAQCGKFVNDVLETVGYGRMIGDSYDSKVQTINKIGIANTIDDIATGSIFAYPVKNSSYGHIGIVTGKNADGTINIMDYNYKGDEQQRERMNVNPSEIFNMKGLISKPIVVDSTVYQKQSAGKGLSAVAKEAVKSGQINGTPTVQSGIIEELAKAGEFDKGQGNSTFYTSKPAVKDEIANFTEGYAKRQQAKQIFGKLKADGTLGGATGRFDTLANKGKRFAGAGSTDVNNLNQILSESLSKYMNKISGATVSEAEVERLREQIPNLSMGDKQFIDAFEQYDQSMQRGLDNTLTKYGFNSYDDIKQKIYGSNKSAQPASTSGQITGTISGGTNRLKK